MGDTTIAQNFQYDAGIAAQTILLGATEEGLGGCMLTSVDRDALRATYAIPQRLEILLVIALGKPSEKIILEATKPGGDIKYYRTSDEVHHVPKRALEELIFE